MSNEPSSDNQTAKSDDANALLKYLKPGVQVTIPFIIYLGSKVLVELKEIDPQHTYYLVGGGLIFVALWVIYDIFLHKTDADAQAALYDALEPKDASARAAVHKSLQTIGIIECRESMKPQELLVADTVNTRCFHVRVPRTALVAVLRFAA